VGQAKKVKGEEHKFRLALALGVSVFELETSMSYSEYLAWQEYLNTVPTVNEIQMAQLLHIQTAKVGVKNVGVEDYLISKPVNNGETHVVDMDDMTVEQLNKLMEV